MAVHDEIKQFVSMNKLSMSTAEGALKIMGYGLGLLK